MTNSLSSPKPVLLSLDWGTPLHFVRRSGELRVKSGQVWITREGDPDDYVLDAGARVVIGRGDAVLVQPWRHGEVADVAWHASAESWAGACARRIAASGAAAVAAAAGTLAVGLRRAAQAVAALGERAATLAAPPRFI